MKLKAVFFDMDGLVLDTEKLYTRFWQEAGIAMGYPMTKEHALGMRSLNREAGLLKMQSYFGESVDYDGTRKKRIELMDAFIEKEGVEVKQGLDVLLRYLKEQGIKTAITTSSPIERTISYLSMVGLEHSFDKLITGYMVKKGKPEPDIYLYASQQFGFQPSECMVLEDSPAGITAAYRAGCLPVMIPDQDEPTKEIEEMLFAKVKSLDLVVELLKKEVE
mgnify:CR=1 FL=1